MVSRALLGICLGDVVGSCECNSVLWVVVVVEVRQGVLTCCCGVAGLFWEFVQAF